VAQENNVQVKDLGISAAARLSGCAENTLRELERRGVVHPIRDSAGRRLFGNDDIAAARRHLGRQDQASA
jgi:DNA-binding transcriptional MerR regulator